MEKLFKEYEEKYLNTKDENYFIDYLNEARAIIKDLEYFGEHIKRTRMSKKYGFVITPSAYGITDWFTRELFQYRISWYGLDEDKMVNTLKLHDITRKLFDLTEHGSKLGIVDDITKWADVIGYFSGIELRDHIHHFIGCSRGIESISSEWDKIIKK